MRQVFVNLDVDDLERAIRFYTEAFGLQIGRRLGDDFVELVGAPVPLYLLLQPAGTPPFAEAKSFRGYGRHWCPIHLDWVVPDIHETIVRAERAGAHIEYAPRREPYGWLAVLNDPFGHGFCFLQLEGRGYDELRVH